MKVSIRSRLAIALGLIVTAAVVASCSSTVVTEALAQNNSIARAKVYENKNDDVGSSMEVSGRGFQQGEFSGLELTVKDSSRFADMPGGWAYFSFGHKPQPYDATANAFPAESCNACHAQNAADDFVFTQFYPVLQAAKASK